MFAPEVDVFTQAQSLGIYYTPANYARALIAWALAGNGKSLMDPSYGGCAFLREGLAALGAPERIYGADIDPSVAAESARELAEQGVPPTNLLTADFLSLRPGIDLPTVDAVVGNPPYVRHHWHAKETRSSASHALRDAGVALDRRSSLWAHFVVHATQFVANGGRLAFLLPGSALQADYAKPLYEFLESSFAHIRLVRLAERIFPDAAEETVVLLASERGESERGKLVVSSAENLADLVTSANAPSPFASNSKSHFVHGTRWDLLDADGKKLVESLISDSRVSPLGNHATVRIGSVTGANEVFLITTETARLLGVSQYVTPTVARNAWIASEAMDDATFRRVSAEKRNLLLDLPPEYDLRANTPLLNYVREAEAKKIHERTHCKREPWWSLGRLPTPDAFLPYMGGAARGLALNHARLASTNAVHQITWRENTSASAQRAIALSSWSSLAQLGFEIYGRTYGGGILKIEPKNAAHIPIVAEVPLLSQRADRLAEPRARANRLLAQIGVGATEIAVLDRNIAKLARHRRGSRAASISASSG